MGKEFIKIGGAREHNLKNLTLESRATSWWSSPACPAPAKSSLAFDTIYAEGPAKVRRESFSVRPAVPRPDARSRTLTSSRALARHRHRAAQLGHEPALDVATTTEIYDYLRLLYANVGQPHCPRNGHPHRAANDE